MCRRANPLCPFPILHQLHACMQSHPAGYSQRMLLLPLPFCTAQRRCNQQRHPLDCLRHHKHRHCTCTNAQCSALFQVFAAQACDDVAGCLPQPNSNSKHPPEGLPHVHSPCAGPHTQSAQPLVHTTGHSRLRAFELGALKVPSIGALTAVLMPCYPRHPPQVVATGSTSLSGTLQPHVGTRFPIILCCLCANQPSNQTQKSLCYTGYHTT